MPLTWCGARVQAQARSMASNSWVLAQQQPEAWLPGRRESTDQGSRSNLQHSDTADVMERDISWGGSMRDQLMRSDAHEVGGSPPAAVVFSRVA